MKGGTFKQWLCGCECGFEGETWGWNYDMPFPCPNCSGKTHLIESNSDRAPAVIGDELNNYAAKHGVCNPDGSPRVFHSKTDLKRALNEKGLTIFGDTPKPYKV